MSLSFDTLMHTIDHAGRPGDTPNQRCARSRALLLDARGAILNQAASEGRGMTPGERTDREAINAKLGEVDEALAQIVASEQRSSVLAAAHAADGPGGQTLSGSYGLSGAHVSGGETYHRGAHSPSFFRDLIGARCGDADAADRLRRNRRETGQEARALGNTGAVGGSGGELAPPAWLVEEYVKLARPGRVMANLMHHEEMPMGVSSVNLPRVGTGTTTAVQSTQNTVLSQTDLTTNALTSGVVTIAGKQIVSQQLLDQSGVAFDRVVLEDLTADLARQVGQQALTGTGTSGQLRGYLTATSTNNLVWTTSTPTAPGFYGRLAQLQGQINTSRFKSPDAIVMHPRRWAWFASYTDSTGRPLVVPTSGGPYNSMSGPTSNQAAGLVGSVLGCDVFVDPNIPINLGAGTNQDVVIMTVRDDLWFWEGDLRCEAFTAPYADSLGVLYRAYNYYAAIPDRYPASLGQVTGVGLVTPVYAN